MRRFGNDNGAFDSWADELFGIVSVQLNDMENHVSSARRVDTMNKTHVERTGDVLDRIKSTRLDNVVECI